jgi:hypothetical protein
MTESTVQDLPISSRIIEIDSRDFVSIEKACMEMETNSDESYYRLEQNGISCSSKITFELVRKNHGSILSCIDEAEGMDYPTLLKISEFGGAFGALATSGVAGRSFFGRGLKQSIFALGSGTIESIKDGMYAKVTYFRDKNGMPKLNHHGKRAIKATEREHKMVGIPVGANGTRVTIFIEREDIATPQIETLRSTLSNHYSMRDIVNRRKIFIRQVRTNGTVVKEIGPLVYMEPEHAIIVGPNHPVSFSWNGQNYEAELTLKKAINTNLESLSDERLNGLMVKADIAVLDCTLFKFDRTTGTERFFGEVQCDALHRLLGEGQPVVNASRNGLNRENGFVKAFSQAIEAIIEPHILQEREKRERVEKAQTTEQTRKKIKSLLENFNDIAKNDLNLLGEAGSNKGRGPNPSAEAMRFTLPRYHRKVNRMFKVTLVVDTRQITKDSIIRFECEVPDTIEVLTTDMTNIVEGTKEKEEFNIQLIGHRVGDKGMISATLEDDQNPLVVSCEVIIQPDSEDETNDPPSPRNPPQRGGNEFFNGWEFKSLNTELERTHFDAQSKLIFINTDAPTVKLYVDEHGRYRDDKSGVVLLAELLMDCITEQLARAFVQSSPMLDGDTDAVMSYKNNFIRQYGTIFHQVLLEM